MSSIFLIHHENHKPMGQQIDYDYEQDYDVEFGLGVPMLNSGKARG